MGRDGYAFFKCLNEKMNEPFNLNKLFDCFSDDSLTLHDFVTLKVHFKDITCLKYRRNVYLTWDSMFGKFYELSL